MAEYAPTTFQIANWIHTPDRPPVCKCLEGPSIQKDDDGEERCWKCGKVARQIEEARAA